MLPPVKIYTLSTCGHCKATKRFLDTCKVHYEFTDVDLLTGDEREAIIEEVKNYFTLFITGRKTLKELPFPGSLSTHIRPP